MKALILAPSFPPEIKGAGNLFHELAQDLVRMGHEVSVVTCVPRKLFGISGDSTKYESKIYLKEKMDGITVTRVYEPFFDSDSTPAKIFQHLITLLAYLLGGFFSGPQDVILVYSPPLAFGIVSYLLGKMKNAPFVFNVQDIFPQYVVDLGIIRNRTVIEALEFLERFIYRKSASVVVHSAGNRDFLVSRGLPAQKVAVGLNWTDVDTIFPSEKRNAFSSSNGLDNYFKVSYAGMMGKAQDMDVIIDCAALIKDSGKIRFILVGEGPEKESAQRKVHDFALDNVLFLPVQPKHIYPSVLAASDICLVNLKKDISTPVVPSKILNIMAAGRPVVASMPLDGDGAKLVRDSECGICVPPGDAPALAGAILKLYKNPSLLQTMGSNGRAVAVKQFSRSACIREYENLLLRAFIR